MTIIRCTDCAFDNACMTEAGYEIIAIESWAWDDGHNEVEILWAKEEIPIAAGEVPF